MIELHSSIQGGMKVGPCELWNVIISVNLVQIELLKARGYTTGTASSVRREFLSQFSNWVRMWPFRRPLGILQTSREIACSLTLHFDSVHCECRLDTAPVTWLDGSWATIIITKKSNLRRMGCSSLFISCFVFFLSCLFYFIIIFLPFSFSVFIFPFFFLIYLLNSSQI